jgi:hypothetical protein
MLKLNNLQEAHEFFSKLDPIKREKCLWNGLKAIGNDNAVITEADIRLILENDITLFDKPSHVHWSNRNKPSFPITIFKSKKEAK